VHYTQNHEFDSMTESIESRRRYLSPYIV